MLKRKLTQAGIIMSGFVSMALAAENSVVSTKNYTDSTTVYKTGSHHFDSSGLCTCIPAAADHSIISSLRLQLNKNAAPFVHAYIKKNGYFIGKTKKRIHPYFSMIDSAFEDCGLPVELKYLAYIESGFNYNARSWAGAVGPWALMPKAARQYGLKISGPRDERLDYYKSTMAASLLLADLFEKYDDWLLVVAAYNSGPGWVDKAIKRSGSHNYWTLQNFLPVETRSHVKKFIAVHYYFEGHGSLVTMTKGETEKHVKAVEEFVLKQQEELKRDSSEMVLKNYN
jgi:membrane-bound lytic murein transglycosylase D